MVAIGGGDKLTEGDAAGSGPGAQRSGQHTGGRAALLPLLPTGERKSGCAGKAQQRSSAQVARGYERALSGARGRARQASAHSRVEDGSARAIRSPERRCAVRPPPRPLAPQLPVLLGSARREETELATAGMALPPAVLRDPEGSGRGEGLRRSYEGPTPKVPGGRTSTRLTTDAALTRSLEATQPCAW